MSKCVIISAIDHVNRRTKTVVKGDATSSTLTSFTTKQEAMTANGSQHTYGHRGARWELFISTSVPGVCVGGKLDRACRWLLTKPPSALVTCGADQRDEATAAMWRHSEAQRCLACSDVSFGRVRDRRATDEVHLRDPTSSAARVMTTSAAKWQ